MRHNVTFTLLSETFTVVVTTINIFGNMFAAGDDHVCLGLVIVKQKKTGFVV